MTIHVLTDANLRQLELHDQLLAYADAYLAASKVLCERTLEVGRQADWTDGSVVLWNAAHAVELFLKGILLKRDPSVSVGMYQHDIAGLANEYEARFTGAEFAWDIPFRRQMPEDLSADVAQQVKVGTAPPSIELRYPLSKLGQPLLTQHGYIPEWFLCDLIKLEDDFARIRSCVA